MNRLRHEIVDLETGKTYMNESLAEKDIGISRYYIHKSLTKNIECKGKMFAYYSYGSDLTELKAQYLWNSEQNQKRLNNKEITNG